MQICHEHIFYFFLFIVFFKSQKLDGNNINTLESSENTKKIHQFNAFLSQK